MQPDANTTRILVVDDDDALRESVADVLLGLGFEVESARNGFEALKKQRQKPFHIILSDIVMPDCDGFELIQQVKKEFPEIRIIAMSGGGPMDTERCLKVATYFGAKKILSKPFDIKALMKAIEEGN